MQAILWGVLTGLLAGGLGWLAWIDLRTHRLPDRLTLPLIALGLCGAALEGWDRVVAGAIGGVAAYALLALVGHLHFNRTGREGLGLGDAKLFAAAGTWLGWAALPMVMLIAAGTALVFALLTRRGGTQIAFGPWIALGFMIVWLIQTAPF
ncbi:prepilin peptidase [Sulfitobacter albidus]|uniref:Prepilin peptidase n=1 Tax=Sulfitobacter albidus TaxID=2829501 RepID=A0A975PMG1_9RHOB|nr:A24 family peptidase [Sulfitobacter albidus]QUJ76772.1 prepilin peptidase [Sulfitobacter albidus]